MLRRRGRWVGLALGVALAAIDTATARALGVTFQISGRDATVGVWIFLASSFGLLGFLAGLLYELRARERRALETLRGQAAELDSLRRRLAQSEKLAAMGQLSAAISHELRNPLAIIRTSVQNLEEEAGDAAEVARVCAFVRDEIDRLSHVATSILGFSRPLAPDRSDVPVSEVLGRVALLAPPEVEERRIRLEIVDRSGDATVHVDRDLLGQALLGLVDNASRVSPEHGRVVVAAERHGDEVVLAVRDDGPGVPEEARERIFEPFFSTREGGHGLGLAVAREIARAHGATLTVADNDDGGACFQVVLPAAVAASVEGAA